MLTVVQFSMVSHCVYMVILLSTQSLQPSMRTSLGQNYVYLPLRLQFSKAFGLS